MPQNQDLNIANLTTVSAISCSAENRTYLYFPVKFYPVNVTGSVSISLSATILDSVTGIRQYAHSDVSLTIDNGEIKIFNFFAYKCTFMHFYA